MRASKQAVRSDPGDKQADRRNDETCRQADRMQPGPVEHRTCRLADIEAERVKGEGRGARTRGEFGYLSLYRVVQSKEAEPGDAHKHRFNRPIQSESEPGQPDSGNTAAQRHHR